MTTPRPHPFDLVFGEFAAARFPAVRDAVGPDLTLAHFLMTPAAVELLHELRPDEGLGDAVDDFVAFVHAAFRYWHDGGRTVVLDVDATRGLGAGAQRAAPLPPVTQYIQIAPRILWSQVESSEIHEPIDGWFAIPEGEQLRVVACLGLHSERPGLSVLTAVGASPATVQRDDGTPPFAPAMEGGAAAGLHSVVNAEELLWLAWRAAAVA